MEVIEYRPGKKVQIKTGLFYSEIYELDDIVTIKGQEYYKLIGSSHFWKLNEIEEITA